MSLGLIKMWVSFVAMGFMIVASLLMLWSRIKLKGFFKWAISIVAICFLVFGGILMVIVIVSGPGT